MIEMSLYTSSVRISLLIWKGGEIGRRHSLLSILAGVTQELEAMFCTSKRLGILGWRLTIYIKSCVGRSVIGVIQHPYQVKDLMKKGTEPIDEGLGHPPVNLSLHYHA